MITNAMHLTIFLIFQEPTVTYSVKEKKSIELGCPGGTTGGVATPERKVDTPG